MRKDPPFDMEYVYSTYLLECAEREGARVFNRPRAIRDHNEKLAIAKFGAFISPTLVTRDAALIAQFIDEHEDVVVKPLDGMGGTSVFRVGEADPNRNVIVETVSHHGKRTVMVQKYLPEIVDGDKRILLIGGNVVPYSLARIPKPGETRGNLAAGGRGEARPLSSRDREIAETLAPTLWAEGLLIVGLDVIGPCLTEVNVTSPTCFVEIAEQSRLRRGRDCSRMCCWTPWENEPSMRVGDAFRNDRSATPTLVASPERSVPGGGVRIAGFALLLGNRDHRARRGAAGATSRR